MPPFEGLVLTGGSTVSPHERVAGLPLALRAALTLRAVGAVRVYVAAEDDDLIATLQDDRRGLEVERFVGQGDKLLAIPHHTITARGVLEALVAAPTGTAATQDGELVGPALLGPDAIASIASGGALDELPLEHLEIEGMWSADVSTPAGRKEAVHQLFEACRKPVDGIVSRHLNRHVSIFISKRLVNLPVTPNMMTGVTFLLAVVAAYFAARGTYESTLIAGVMMQLNSIVDGCDGELARVRHQGSTLGQWLDTIGDDLSNVIFWAALGYGALSHGEWLAYSGWIASAANSLSALVNYWMLAQLGSGDYYALDDGETSEGVIGRIFDSLSILFKQDFFLFVCMGLAIAGILWQALPVIAAAMVIALINSIVRAVRLRR